MKCFHFHCMNKETFPWPFQTDRFRKKLKKKWVREGIKFYVYSPDDFQFKFDNDPCIFPSPFINTSVTCTWEAMKIKVALMKYEWKRTGQITSFW